MISSGVVEGLNNKVKVTLRKSYGFRTYRVLELSLYLSLGKLPEPEGEQLVSVPLGHTDTDNTTCLHARSIGLVVAGDSAYNDVHLHLGESNAETREAWIAALDTIESLKPTAVVAGHKRAGAVDTPNIIEETRKYIRDFDRIAANTQTASVLYNQMLAIYPERVNPSVLWLSARAIKPAR